MRMRMKNRWGIVLGIAMGIAFSLPARADSGAYNCAAATPIVVSNTAVVGAGREFVVRRVVTDHILHQNWAVFEDCAHPERPPKMVQVAAPSSLQNIQTVERPHAKKIATFSTQAVLPVMQRTVKNRVEARLESVSPPFSHQAISSTLSHSTAPSAPRPLLVRAGDRVRLWSAGTNVRLEIEAIALEYGRAGQVIHLRRLGNDTAGQRVILTGVVDGAGSAELLP
jgi:hypothetical protein